MVWVWIFFRYTLALGRVKFGDMYSSTARVVVSCCLSSLARFFLFLFSCCFFPLSKEAGLLL